jgi:hypothetical protein
MRHTFSVSVCTPPAALAAENLFLRKQLALYQERHVRPRRVTEATRIVLTILARWFDWRQALVIVQPYMALGPGIPQPPPPLPVPLQAHCHRLPEHLRAVTHALLGGLHHDYRLEKKAA